MSAFGQRGPYSVAACDHSWPAVPTFGSVDTPLWQVLKRGQHDLGRKWSHRLA